MPLRSRSARRSSDALRYRRGGGTPQWSTGRQRSLHAHRLHSARRRHVVAVTRYQIGELMVSRADQQKDPEAGILAAWERNASPWIDAVREHRIESRRLVTDRAIIEAVLSRKPETVLDIGCGEGWLVRALTADGIHAKGVDAIPELIESARSAGGTFELLSYQDLTSERRDLSANVFVCNFALFGHRSVERLFAAM